MNLSGLFTMIVFQISELFGHQGFHAQFLTKATPMLNVIRAVFGLLTLALVSSPGSAALLPEPAFREHWECVPFARAVSGVSIFGDAHTWWDQAEGRYQRGEKPRLGAVMAFIPHGRMELGHVATVSAIVDRRTLLVTHANWSPINGRRGQVERDVRVIDVSPDGDWSAVRVWYGPNEALGGGEWPVHGFIYPKNQGPVPKAQPPRLQYASVLNWQPVATTRAAAVRPTGRLAYLDRALSKIN